MDFGNLEDDEELEEAVVLHKHYSDLKGRLSEAEAAFQCAMERRYWFLPPMRADVRSAFRAMYANQLVAMELLDDLMEDLELSIDIEREVRAEED